ncbi:MAG: hypothetical protein QOF59_2661 [Actinomycetota bacterium]|jgi:hypothetical protein|nr:hypothetical protein [Actinomycetota bacterium]MDQ1476406.1 hypothetical protein [Actinomycetota bacterium]
MADTAVAMLSDADRESGDEPLGSRFPTSGSRNDGGRRCVDRGTSGRLPGPAGRRYRPAGASVFLLMLGR